MTNTSQTPKRLTRKQINEGLDSVPISYLVGSSSKGLTSKQKAFAREVAMGATGAGAYRKVYSEKARPRTAGNAASLMKQHSGIALEIDAIRRAQEAEHIKNPAALRLLVINTLVELATNPDTKDAVRLQDVKVLGGVTEVAAFTERKETRVITSSDDARAEILAELRALSNADAIDVETEAADLLGELESARGATHPTPTPTDEPIESRQYIHTIPPEQSPINSIPVTPPHPFREDPPVGDLVK